MEQVRVSVEDDPARRDIDALVDGLDRYNMAAMGGDDGQPLGVFLRDEQERMLGGAFGFTWCNVLEVKYLWVADELRKSGYGSALLRAAEREATARGCHTLMLDTYEFQAPRFYEKLGYSCYGVIDDPQTRVRKYFFKRALTAPLPE